MVENPMTLKRLNALPLRRVFDEVQGDKVLATSFTFFARPCIAESSDTTSTSGNSNGCDSRSRLRDDPSAIVRRPARDSTSDNFLKFSRFSNLR